MVGSDFPIKQTEGEKEKESDRKTLGFAFLLEKGLRGFGVGAEGLGGVRVSESKWGSVGSEVEEFKGDRGGVRGFKRDVMRRVEKE